MCGRFTLTVNPNEAQLAFSGFTFPKQFAPRYNIAPSQPILAIPNDRNRAANFFLWGLIPSWATDPSKALINARGETLAEKPSFRGAFKYKRCLIPADGFYEWKANEKIGRGKTRTDADFSKRAEEIAAEVGVHPRSSASQLKTPYFIHLKERGHFAFAGLWNEWHSPEGDKVKTCTIITTAPNELMSALHNRMPVILDPKDYAEWLDPAPRSPESLARLIRPFPAERMAAYPVSLLVNNPSNDLAECVAPMQG